VVFARHQQVGGQVGSPTGGHTGWGLLGTKVVPPTIPRGYLRRPRLEKLLDAGASGPLTLVSAGPGWGKTLAVASWVRHRQLAHHAATRQGSGHPEAGTGAAQSGRPVDQVADSAWLALDVDDNELRVFWTGVVTALRQADAVPPDSELATLALEAGLTAKGMQRLRDGLAALRPGTVLVLDDLQVVRNPEVLESIAVLLRHELPLRLVLISRTDPVLPLHRLRVNGGLQEIRALDLAFDEDEAREFLRLGGQLVAADDVTRLVERTEGWAAGLRLAGMFLSRHDAPGRADQFAGDDRAVAEYLLGEVFASQPADMRTFLLRTSITDRICGELADVLTDDPTDSTYSTDPSDSTDSVIGRGFGFGHGQRRLESLEQANTFITSLGPRRLWYRYHPLLREALEHQLLVEDPELHRALHRRAAVWLSAHGAPVAGLRHAAAAQDWVLLGDLFATTAGPRILSAERRAINETLALIPESELARTAALQACAAARLDYRGRHLDIAPLLGRARRMLAQQPSPGAAETAVTNLWGASVGRATGDMRVVLDACDTVLATLNTMESTFPAAEEYGAIAAVNRSVAQVWTGDLAGARADLGPAIVRCQRVDLDAPRLNGLGCLALATVLSGRPAEASAVADEARTLAERRGWTSLNQSAIGDLARALVLLIQGKPAEAEMMLVQASAATNEFLMQVAIRIVHSLLNTSWDRPHAAVRYARSARDMIAGRTVPDFVAGWLTLAEAKAAVAAGDPRAALRLLSTDGTAPRWWAVQFAVCSARAWLALADLPRAERALAATSAAAEDPTNPVAAVEVWVAKAVLAERLHDERGAAEAIIRAVRIAAPDGIARPFLFFDRDRIPRVLGRLWGLDAAEEGFVSRLASAGLRPPTPDTGDGMTLTEDTPLVEPLTERELAVLQLLPTMQSNLEIAEEMFVSVNTVKLHLKTLYRKLDVPNRRSAVRRSRTLGLIP